MADLRHAQVDDIPVDAADDVKIVQEALHDLPASHPCAGPGARALDRLAQAQRDLTEKVAEALYERAMGERRVFSARPGQFNRRWRDEPYVPPLADGESRPTDWRDGWRDEARAVLLGQYADG